MVKDLHTLLINANVPGPYVLVGWSVAGFNLRLYTSQYPSDVVGIVLVDSSHPDQFARWLAVLPPPSPKESAALRDFRKDLTTNGLFEDPTKNSEGMDIEASAAQVRTSGSLGARPLVVLTAGRSDWPAGFPSDLVTKLDQVWLALQKELVSLSSNSSHVIAKRSRHCIMCSEPELIIEAIRKVVTEVQRK
jgi:pimeloyl-ACP methyl ester carboxylesterase